MSNLLGQTIGKCRIEKLLGSGGMGEVYRCRHIHLDRLQAIKVMHEHLALDPGFQARFRQEAHAVALLDHAHIVKLYDFGEQDGRYYLTMELLEDGSLRALLDRRARERQIWPPSFGLGLVRQAAEALAFAHAHGIVHRDIKPDNLLILRQKAADGRSSYTIKVSDFGLARMAEGGGLTSVGGTVGTPAYMSPEQCQGESLDGRSDVYSLGVVLYEVMTGFLPFNTSSPSDAIRKHVFTPVPPPRSVKPDLSPDIEAVILRCLAKSPADRYQSAADLVTALRELQRALAASATPPPAAQVDTAARHIEVYDAQGQMTQELELADKEITIGRLPDNDIVLNDPTISRKHLLVEWNGQRVKIVDLATKIGTRLAGQPIQPNAPQNWVAGQPIQIGAYTLQLVVGTAGIVTVTLPPSARRMTIAAGQPVSFPLTIHNRGAAAETFAVFVDEWPAEWIADAIQPLTVPPGAQASTTMKLLVPEGALRDAGSYRVMVRALGLGNLDSTDVTTAVWTVTVPQRPRVQLQLDPERAQGRDQARYTIRLVNDGQLPAEVVLSVQDARQQLGFGLEQSRLSVAPGATVESGLSVRASGGRFVGGAVTHTFTVTATVVGGDEGTATGTFVQTPLLSI